MKGSPLLLQIVLHIHMYMLRMYVCAYACVGLYRVYINQYCCHLLLKIFTKVCSLKCEYQKNSFLHCEVPRIKQLQGKFDQPTHVSAYLNVQPLFSTEYTKPLVTIQVLFLKHRMDECVRGWKIHPTHPLSTLKYTHPHTRPLQELQGVITKVPLETAPGVSGQSHYILSAWLRGCSILYLSVLTTWSLIFNPRLSKAGIQCRRQGNIFCFHQHMGSLTLRAKATAWSLGRLA